jgi:glycosyltransferase involved in cell wall biosynthesis
LGANLVVVSYNTSRYVYLFRRNLIRRMLDNGYSVHVVAPSDSYTEKLIAMGCAFTHIWMRVRAAGPFHDAAILLNYLRIYRRLRPCVALHYTIKPNIYGSLAARLAGVPVINNIAGLGYVFIGRSVLQPLVRMLYAAALSKAHCVFFQNRDDQEFFLNSRIVAPYRSRLIPGSGVDLRYFAPQIQQERNTGFFTFLLISRMLWDKGIKEYVEAARTLKGRNPALRFQLLGEADADNPRAISSAEIRGWTANDWVEYLGEVEDVRPYIAAADCLVLPSYREGVPHSLLEGAAMAKPLIAADAPGTREPVENGVNGFLCRLKDPDDLARKMERMLELGEEERRAMGQASRRKVQQDFDEESVIDRYMTEVEAAFRARGW